LDAEILVPHKNVTRLFREGKRKEEEVEKAGNYQAN